MATSKKFNVLYLLVLIVLAVIFIFIWYKYLPEKPKNTSVPTTTDQTTTSDNKNSSTEPQNESEIISKDQQSYARGIDSINHGDYNQAIAYFDQAIKENPNEINYYSLKAQAELLAGKKTDAVSTIESGLKIDPGNDLLNSKLDVLNNDNLSSPDQDNPRL